MSLHEYTARFYHQGETIFNEGVGGDSAFLVKSGKVSVTRQIDNDTVPLAEFGPGEIFGEMAILMPSPRTATATMVEAGDLILVPKDRFLEQLEQAPPIVRTMFYSLMNRLHATTERLRAGQGYTLFLSVCRLLNLVLDRLAQHETKALPYRDVLTQVKDVLLASDYEVEEVFFKLQDLNLISFDKDGDSSKSFIFKRPADFLEACERHYRVYATHLDPAAGPAH